MKNRVLGFLCFLGVVFGGLNIYADSPINSAYIFRAYEDLELVQKALVGGTLDIEFLSYLDDSKNSMDQRLALISAMFYSPNFKKEDDFARVFVEYAYGRSLEDLKKEDFLEDDLVLIAYMKAMQQDQSPSLAQGYMDDALERNEESLVVNLIHILFRAHRKIVEGNISGDFIYEYWLDSIQEISEKVREEKVLFDLRPAFLEHYFKFMILPENTSFSISVEPSLLILNSGEEREIKVHGGNTPFQVEILKGDGEIDFDGVNLRVRGTSEGQTDYILSDRFGVSVQGSVFVKGPKEGEYEKSEIEFFIDRELFLRNGEEIEIDPGQGTKPVLNEDGRTLIPIRAFIESIGGIVGWNPEKREILLSLNHKTISLLLDKTDAYVNGELFQMDTKPVIINNRTMVPLRFVSENLGFEVLWIPETRKIEIIAFSQKVDLAYLQKNGNHVNYGFVTKGDQWYYFVKKNDNEYGLFRKNLKDFREEELLKESLSYLNWRDGFIYFTGQDSKIYRIHEETKEKELLLDVPVNEMIIVGDFLFFTAGNLTNRIEDERFLTRLYKLDLASNTTKIELIYDKEVWDLNTDGEFIYFRHLMQPQREEGIYRIGLDGENFARVTNAFVYFYILRDDQIYYLDINRNIKRFVLGQNKHEMIVEGYVYSFNISKNHIVYVSVDDNSIYATDLYGKNKRKIRGIPERTIVDINFFENLAYIYFDFSVASTSAKLNDYVFNLDDLHTIRPESDQLILTDQKIKQMVEEQLDVPKNGEEIVVLTTTKGEIKIRLFREEAPKAVENFLGLVTSGYYEGLSFHRIIHNFMIQTGDPIGNGSGGQSVWGEPFEDEIHPGRVHLRGALAMANMGPNTNGSQFFIVQKEDMEDYIIEQLEIFGMEDYLIEAYKNFGGAPWLDGRHTVFGHVFEGIEVVDEISKVEMEDRESGISKERVLIEKAEIKYY
jgi:peptidyl-prolyl cis-trans isomerase B (cyclophilin B)